MQRNIHSSQSWPIFLFTIGVFMAGLDNGIISTALTTINESFNVSPSWGAWSITLYTLGVAISVPIIGKFADRYGRRRLFIIEIFLFGLGSLLVALSPNFIFLLAARFIQAIGGGGIFIIGSSHVLATLPKEKQGRALGILGGMHGLSAVAGPNLGAIILTMTGSWQWLFLINIPIAIFLIIFGFLKIPETKVGYTKPLDGQGILYLSIGILAMMFSITNMDSSSFLLGFLDIRVLIPFIFGLGVLFVFLSHEQEQEARGGDPIISYSLLKTKKFQLTLILGLLSGGFLAGIIFIPSYVQQVLLIPAEKAGFWVTPLALASGIGAGVGGVLTDKIGAVRTIIFSGAIGVAGFFLFPLWVDELWIFVIASILAGIGLGILLGAPLNVLVGESARRIREGEGSALGTLSLIRQVGLTLFPTLYAGFITSGLMNVEQKVVSVFGEETLDFQDVDPDDTQEAYLYIIEQIERIKDETLQIDMLEVVSQAVNIGYDQMFMTSGVLSLIVIMTGCYLLVLR